MLNGYQLRDNILSKSYSAMYNSLGSNLTKYRDKDYYLLGGGEPLLFESGQANDSILFGLLTVQAIPWMNNKEVNRLRTGVAVMNTINSYSQRPER